MAIGMEDEAVGYYTGLAAGKTGLNTAVLNLIADEEKRHGDLLRGHNRRRLFPLKIQPLRPVSRFIRTTKLIT
jgi:hypothetical protein